MCVCMYTCVYVYVVLEQLANDHQSPIVNT